MVAELLRFFFRIFLVIIFISWIMLDENRHNRNSKINGIKCPFINMVSPCLVSAFFFTVLVSIVY